MLLIQLYIEWNKPSGVHLKMYIFSVVLCVDTAFSVNTRWQHIIIINIRCLKLVLLLDKTSGSIRIRNTEGEKTPVKIEFTVDQKKYQAFICI